MNTHTAYSGKRDPINCPANQPDPRKSLQRLKSAVGSCTCLTKTPEVKFHSPDCQYRKIMEQPATDKQWTPVYGSIDCGNGKPFLSCGTYDNAKSICDAHNAERDAHRTVRHEYQHVLVFTRQQLAAEQEKVKNLHRILGKKRTEIRDLKEQLATVRELREDDLRTIMQLRERVEQPEEK